MDYQRVGYEDGRPVAIFYPDEGSEIYLLQANSPSVEEVHVRITNLHAKLLSVARSTGDEAAIDNIVNNQLTETEVVREARQKHKLKASGYLKLNDGGIIEVGPNAHDPEGIVFYERPRE